MPHPHVASEAKIVAFRPHAIGGVRRDADRDDTERGTILLFTGVRYERMTDVADAAEAEQVDIGFDDDLLA